MISGRPGSCRGFTLVETVIVLGVIASLMVLSMAGYMSAAKANAITTAAALISDTLVDARGYAVAQNTTVEVRIYSLSQLPGAAPVYGAVQLRWIKSDGTTPAIIKPVLLPTGIAIDATAEHSPLIGANSQAATPDTSDALLNSQTHVFHFLPDGSTDLSPATNWFLTVRSAAQSDPARFPDNWACVRVDAATGRVQTYRP